MNIEDPNQHHEKSFIVPVYTLLLLASACATIGFGGGVILCRIVHG